MSKRFNIAGSCKPNLHYMVDIQKQLEVIKGMVDLGDYFVINRARQYGKTTTLRALKTYLADEYIVVDMDFQRQMSSAKFKNEHVFSLAFANAFFNVLWKKKNVFSTDMREALLSFRENIHTNIENAELVELFIEISDVCAVADKPIVLLVDEVDSATNNQVFLDFLAQLRGYYLDRDELPLFHSVILAGVYDVKNLKQKIRPTEEHKTNSPWNTREGNEPGERYIVELKIWHGEEYNRRGVEQLGDYLDAYHLKKGYMLSFNFNKDKEVGVKEVIAGDKVIVEAVV